jgi:amidase
VTLLTDAFALADAEVRGGLDTLVGAVADQLGGAIIEAQLTDEKTWQRWTSGFRVLQSAEAFAEHGDFYRRHGPSVLGDDVAARFEFASRVTDADRKAANGVRSEVLNRLEELTEGGTCVVLMPAAPTRAPLRNRPETDTAAISRLRRLTSIASLAGAPSVTVPSRTTTPVGLSLVGAPGSDEMLIDLAAGIHQFLSF